MSDNEEVWWKVALKVVGGILAVLCVVGIVLGFLLLFNNISQGITPVTEVKTKSGLICVLANSDKGVAIACVPPLSEDTTSDEHTDRDSVKYQ